MLRIRSGVQQEATQSQVIEQTMFQQEVLSVPQKVPLRDDTGKPSAASVLGRILLENTLRKGEEVQVSSVDITLTKAKLPDSSQYK